MANPTDAPPPPAPAATPAGDVDVRGYRRLPGRAATLRVGNYGQRRLYLGRDHLLQVEGTVWVEHYRRFAYADIQSLLLRQTPRGTILSIVLAVLAAAFGLLAYTSGDPTDEGGLFCLVTTGVCALLLVVNLLRGPTCTCHLQTTISLQVLPSLSRLRPARRALELLTTRIEAVQGALSTSRAAEMVDERLAQRG